MGHLNLASNALQNLTGDEFNDAQQLTKLALSHNPLELKEGKVLVNVTDLEVLNLIGCNITELYNSTFAPNSGLLKLNLNKNPLPEVNSYLESQMELRIIRFLFFTFAEDQCARFSFIDKS